MPPPDGSLVDGDVVLCAALLAGKEQWLEQAVARGGLRHECDAIQRLKDSESALESAYLRTVLPPLRAELECALGRPLSERGSSMIFGPAAIPTLSAAWFAALLLQELRRVHAETPLRVVVPSQMPASLRACSSHEQVDGLLRANTLGEFARDVLHLAPERLWTIIESQTPPEAPKSNRGNVVQRVDAWLRHRMRCDSPALTRPWQALFSVALSTIPVATRSRPTGAITQRGAAESSTDPLLALVAERVVPPAMTRLGHAIQGLARRFDVTGFRRGYGRLVSHHIYEDRTNIRNALAHDAGEVVVGVQHGGGYGTLAVLPISPQTEFIAGPFITWGWDGYGSYDVDSRPLPSPSLTRLKNIRQRREGSGIAAKIVFVGASMDMGLSRIHSKPIGIEWLRYRSWKLRFLSGLSSEMRRDFYYRGHFVAACGLEDELWIRSNFPDIQLLRGRLPDAMAEARAIVVDHPITALHQAMACGCPTIGFWDQTAWRLSETARPEFEMLSEAGVLLASPEEAARALNELGDCIEDWWRTPDVQKAVSAWCHRFARTDQSWRTEWLKALFTSPNSEPSVQPPDR